MKTVGLLPQTCSGWWFFLPMILVKGLRASHPEVGQAFSCVLLRPWGAMYCFFSPSSFALADAMGLHLMQRRVFYAIAGLVWWICANP